MLVLFWDHGDLKVAHLNKKNLTCKLCSPSHGLRKIQDCFSTWESFYVLLIKQHRFHLNFVTKLKLEIFIAIRAHVQYMTVLFVWRCIYSGAQRSSMVMCLGWGSLGRCALFSEGTISCASRDLRF